MTKFEIGDIVNIRGFSPRMVVLQAPFDSATGTYQCFWYDNERRGNVQNFPEAILMKDQS